MGKFSRLGNDLYTGRKSIDFIGRARLWYLISGLIVVLAILGLSLRGLNLGIEFKGGSEFTASTPSKPSQALVDEVRSKVAGLGIKGASSPIVNTAGSSAGGGDYSIAVQTEVLTPSESAQVSKTISDTANPAAGEVSVEAVGPSWGSQVAKQATTALIVFLILVVLFIWAYFREWKMSVGALVALAHDVVITVGVYALSGFQVTPATVTGLLTILGFSLYDTVVVFDKVRENTKNLRSKKTTYAKAANLAVNQTLVRSINTSIVALIPVGVILLVSILTLGSGPLKDLALALFVGMAAGTYSSIFIATPLVVQLKSGEKAVTDAERRERARAKRSVDRYASVPAFTEDMPIHDDPGADDDAVEVEEPVSNPASSTPVRRDEATGSGRVLPTQKAPLGEGGSSRRTQPKREPRSKRK